LTREQQTQKSELFGAMDYLIRENIKMHKGIKNRTSAVEYFRGVDFHVMVLKKAKGVQQYLPSFKTDKGKYMPLNTIEDSVKLG